MNASYPLSGLRFAVFESDNDWLAELRITNQDAQTLCSGLELSREEWGNLCVAIGALLENWPKEEKP